jgi:hypothetical protein
LARTKDEGWNEAAALLEEAIKHCTDPVDSEQKWLCTLELASLYCKSLRTRKAKAALKYLPDVSVGIYRGEPYIRNEGKTGFESAKEWEYAIRKSITEAGIHLAEAKASLLPRDRKRQLEEARKAYSDAHKGIKSNFRRKRRWERQIEENIADVLYRKGIKASINEALNILEALKMEEESVFATPAGRSGKRMRDLQCKIACARLRSSNDRKGEAQEALKDLKGVLTWYVQIYGEQNDQTRVCAHLVQEEYKKTGQESEARGIAKQFNLQGDTYFAFIDGSVGQKISTWERPIFALTMVVLVMIAVLFFVADAR